jgi:hypothetical protein
VIIFETRGHHRIISIGAPRQRWWQVISLGEGDLCFFFIFVPRKKTQKEEGRGCFCFPRRGCVLCRRAHRDEVGAQHGRHGLEADDGEPRARRHAVAVQAESSKANFETGFSLHKIKDGTRRRQKLWVTTGFDLYSPTTRLVRSHVASPPPPPPGPWISLHHSTVSTTCMEPKTARNSAWPRERRSPRRSGTSLPICKQLLKPVFSLYRLKVRSPGAFKLWVNWIQLV